MTEQRTVHQRNLARYMAYRVAAWVQMNPQESPWKALSALTKIHKSDMSHIHYGQSSSQKQAMKLSKTLGPAPLEAFLALAEAWAIEYPSWQPGDPIAQPVTHISLSSEDRWAEMAQYMPPRLIRAGRAVLLLEETATEAMVQDAMSLAWSDYKDDLGHATDMTARNWQTVIELKLQRIMRGSGERESARQIKIVRKT